MANNLLPVKEVARRKRCFITTPSDAARRGNLDGIVVDGRVVAIVDNERLRRWQPNRVAQRVRRGLTGKSLRKESARLREEAVTQEADRGRKAFVEEELVGSLPEAPRRVTTPDEQAFDDAITAILKASELVSEPIRIVGPIFNCIIQPGGESTIRDPATGEVAWVTRTNGACAVMFVRNDYKSKPGNEAYWRIVDSIEAVAPDQIRGLLRPNPLRLKSAPRRTHKVRVATRTGKARSKTRAGGRGTRKARAPDDDGDSDSDSPAPAVRRRKLSPSTSSALIEARPRLCALACFVLLLLSGGVCAS